MLKAYLYFRCEEIETKHMKRGKRKLREPEGNIFLYQHVVQLASGAGQREKWGRELDQVGGGETSYLKASQRFCANGGGGGRAGFISPYTYRRGDRAQK